MKFASTLSLTVLFASSAFALAIREVCELPPAPTGTGAPRPPQATPTSSRVATTVATSSRPGPTLVTSSRPAPTTTTPPVVTPSSSSSSSSRPPTTTPGTSIPPIPESTVCNVANANIGLAKDGRFSQACLNLVNDCLKKSDTTHFIWSKTSCVAAATCKGSTGLRALLECRRSELPTENLPDLSYNVYANIVGQCAWKLGGCSMTQQQYIDWFYAALQGVNTNAWPTGEEVVGWWKPIVGWTKTGQTIPYLNWNDWLRYSTPIRN